MIIGLCQKSFLTGFVGPPKKKGARWRSLSRSGKALAFINSYEKTEVVALAVPEKRFV